MGLSLNRFDGVHAALRDRRFGRAYQRRFTPQEFGQPEPDNRWPRWLESERFSLLNLEPPDHTRLRRLISAVFTARSIAALRPEIERLSAEHLDRAMGFGEFDLIADYTQPYSVAGICTLLGVPVGDGALLLVGRTTSSRCTNCRPPRRSSRQQRTPQGSSSTTSESSSPPADGGRNGI